jgi:hypothetical protein
MRGAIRSPTRARAAASTRRWFARPRASSAGARAFASFEDLGVQMNHHSTLVSYLHRLLIVLTGSLGKPGTHFIPTTLVDARRRRGQACRARSSARGSSAAWCRAT